MAAPSAATHAAEANRALAAAGQSDMVWGHASVRDPDRHGVWIKAARIGFEEVTDDRVHLVSDDGEVVEGGGPRHVEYPIHTRIMAARPDVGCVVHTHSQAAVAFASLQVPLRPISHDGVLFVKPEVPRYEGTGSLIKTTALGDELAATLGDAVAVLIPQHGLVTAGADPATAVMYAVLLDRACRVQLQAMACGQVTLWSSDAEVDRKREEMWFPAQFQAGYDYLLRNSRTP
ncbi:MAG TPA: class II aldolase/adducin family protein [Nocardioidaceae bacterium]|nr:class II aldolase/adducin family protein [Nocardioidaceae bacterium]